MEQLLYFSCDRKPIKFEEDTNLLYIDDTGEELINSSSGYGRIVTLNPRMNFSNATLVKISYQNIRMAYGQLSFIDQDLILDDKLNLVVAKYYCGNFIF